MFEEFPIVKTGDRLSHTHVNALSDVARSVKGMLGGSYASSREGVVSLPPPFVQRSVQVVEEEFDVGKVNGLQNVYEIRMRYFDTEEDKWKVDTDGHPYYLDGNAMGGSFEVDDVLIAFWDPQRSMWIPLSVEPRVFEAAEDFVLPSACAEDQECGDGGCLDYTTGRAYKLKYHSTPELCKCYRPAGSSVRLFDLAVYGSRPLKGDRLYAIRNSQTQKWEVTRRIPMAGFTCCDCSAKCFTHTKTFTISLDTCVYEDVKLRLRRGGTCSWDDFTAQGVLANLTKSGRTWTLELTVECTGMTPPVSVATYTYEGPQSIVGDNNCGPLDMQLQSVSTSGGFPDPAWPTSLLLYDTGTVDCIHTESCADCDPVCLQVTIPAGIYNYATSSLTNLPWFNWYADGSAAQTDPSYSTTCGWVASARIWGWDGVGDPTLTSSYTVPLTCRVVLSTVRYGGTAGVSFYARIEPFGTLPSNPYGWTAAAYMTVPAIYGAAYSGSIGKWFPDCLDVTQTLTRDFCFLHPGLVCCFDPASQGPFCNECSPATLEIEEVDCEFESDSSASSSSSGNSSSSSSSSSSSNSGSSSSANSSSSSSSSNNGSSSSANSSSSSSESLNDSSSSANSSSSESSSSSFCSGFCLYTPVVDGSSPTGFSWTYSGNSCWGSCNTCPDGATAVGWLGYPNSLGDSGGIDCSIV